MQSLKFALHVEPENLAAKNKLAWSKVRYFIGCFFFANLVLFPWDKNFDMHYLFDINLDPKGNQRSYNSIHNG